MRLCTMTSSCPMRSMQRLILAAVALTSVSACVLPAQESKSQNTKAPHQVITGKGALPASTQQKPGTFRKITVAALPQPFESGSAMNMPSVVARPANAWPQAAPGFKVEQYASGLDEPRLIR